MVLLRNVILFYFPMLRFLGFLGVMRVNFFFVVFLLESSVCFPPPMNSYFNLMSFICASVINHDITKVMGQ
jgi:hypothetical protein